MYMNIHRVLALMFPCNTYMNAYIHSCIQTHDHCTHRIPNLQLNLLVVNRDHSRAKFYTCDSCMHAYLRVFSHAQKHVTLQP